MKPLSEAIVLAGGLGTRLRTVVGDTPKALALVAGRPFLDWLLDDLSAHGIEHVVLATGYGSEAIEARYGVGHRGLSITISREKEPLGTGGAIRLGCAHTDSASVLAVNGDTYAAWTAERLTAVAATTGSPLTVGLKSMKNPHRYGTVTLDGDRLTGFCEKRSVPDGLINAGIYLLTPADIPWPDRLSFSFEHDVLEAACLQGTLAGAILDGPFIDIGIPEALVEAQTVIPAWAKAAAVR